MKRELSYCLWKSARKMWKSWMLKMAFSCFSKPRYNKSKRLLSQSYRVFAIKHVWDLIDSQKRSAVLFAPLKILSQLAVQFFPLKKIRKKTFVSVLFHFLKQTMTPRVKVCWVIGFVSHICVGCYRRWETGDGLFEFRCQPSFSQNFRHFSAQSCFLKAKNRVYFPQILGFFDNWAFFMKIFFFAT